MWYEDCKKQLDYSKAIFANRKYILLPQIEGNKSYKIIGYNWFNIETGNYNSSITYKTVEEAIAGYTYEITNGKLIIKD